MDQIKEKVNRNINKYANRLTFYPNVKSVIVHACLPKTGSQWFTRFFADPRFEKHAKLHHHNPGYNFIGQENGYLTKLKGIPLRGKIISPLYIKFGDIKKLDYGQLSTKIFYVIRDPRDLIISDYYSMRYSHGVSSEIIFKKRNTLSKLSFDDGIMESINNFDHYFSTLKELNTVLPENLIVVKFEDIFGENQRYEFNKLFSFLNINIEDKVLNELLKKYSFDNMVEKNIQDNKNRHYRSGAHAQWEDIFNKEHIQRFKDLTGDLLIDLGYERDNNWG